MSERTVIGGVSYETVGSSSSNLLLRCNGTARIQWGSKLIDLIKNGKIVSSENRDFIFEVTSEEDIKKDGIYILNTETEEDTKQELLIFKNGQKYSLKEMDLYISATNKQEITVEQQKQALENIGILYNTLADVPATQIQNGLAYVLDQHTLYSIKNGILTAYQAEIKTVTVEKQEQSETDINKSLSTLNNTSFVKGMIIMYHNSEPIPEGWVICDGQEHTYLETVIKTPNLSDKFIKDELGDLVYIMKL